jgi:hypothetical protein
MDLRLDVQGWAELEAAWQKAPQIVREELTRATDMATSLLQAATQSMTPTGVTGHLRASILAQDAVVLNEQVIGVVGTSIAYAAPVELGTRPHFPPVEALEDWVRARLNVKPEEVRGVAFLIARKIAAHGTPAIGMFHRAFAAQRAKVMQMYEDARLRIRDRLAAGEAA